MAVSYGPGIHLSVKVMSAIRCLLSKLLSSMDSKFYKLLETITAEDRRIDTSSVHLYQCLNAFRCRG